MQHPADIVFPSAEFRGPGVHHNYEDSDSGYELDSENKGKNFGVGGYRSRPILLGDGTEVHTDSDDTEMFDNADEDKDLESQVSKKSTTTDKDAAKPTDTSAEPKAATTTEDKPATGSEGEAKAAKTTQNEPTQPAKED